MSDRFSFSSADELISILLSAHKHLARRNEDIVTVIKGLTSCVNDEAGIVFINDLRSVYFACNEINSSVAQIIASVTKYREQLYDEFTDGCIQEIGFTPPQYSPTVRFGSDGEELERKNRILAFQNVVLSRIKDKKVPPSAKTAYAKIGSKCKVASDSYLGTAFYNPFREEISFNMQEDLENPCGELSTYFHEVGHMIDFTANESKRISDDVQFATLLRKDCESYITKTQNRYGCSRDDAYWYISQELLSDNNLYADVSDIMGGLTDGKCQNLWGHSQKYWQSDNTRIQREAFANMFSTIMGSTTRVETMKKYFPNSFSYFLSMLEGI